MKNLTKWARNILVGGGVLVLALILAIAGTFNKEVHVNKKNVVKITQPIKISEQVQPFSKESLELEISYFQNDLDLFIALKNECRKGVNLGKISPDDYNQIVVGYDDEIIFKSAMIKNNKRLIDSINNADSRIAEK